MNGSFIVLTAAGETSLSAFRIGFEFWMHGSFIVLATGDTNLLAFRIGNKYNHY